MMTDANTTEHSERRRMAAHLDTALSAGMGIFLVTLAAWLGLILWGPRDSAGLLTPDVSQAVGALSHLCTATAGGLVSTAGLRLGQGWRGG